MDSGEAAHHLEGVTLGGPGDECVQAVLGSQGGRKLRASPGERGDAPPFGIGCVVRVPRLVCPEEVAEPNVGDPYGAERLPVTGGPREPGRSVVGHSLKAFRGLAVTSSTAVSIASSSSSRCSATR